MNFERKEYPIHGWGLSLSFDRNTDFLLGWVKILLGDSLLNY
jgi:hypothetical protein